MFGINFCIGTIVKNAVSEVVFTTVIHYYSYNVYTIIQYITCKNVCYTIQYNAHASVKYNAHASVKYNEHSLQITLVASVNIAGLLLHHETTTILT